MSKDKILKKTAFGGFKREDVIDYIEKLQQEIVDLKRDAADCAAYKREADELRRNKKFANDIAEATKSENETLKAELSAQIEKNASLTLKLEQLTSILEKSKTDAAEIQEKYNQLYEEHSKITDIKLIEDQAKEKVSRIAGDAKASVDSVYSDVNGAAERLKTVTVNFESSLASLKSGAEALLSVLASASADLESVGTEE